MHSRILPTDLMAVLTLQKKRITDSSSIKTNNKADEFIIIC